MPEPSRIEVLPLKNGKWRWRKTGAESKQSDSFDTRTEAFEDALLEREEEAIVLLRSNGSVHGELYHAQGGGGPPQRVDLLAASTREEAVKIEDG